MTGPGAHGHGGPGVPVAARHPRSRGLAVLRYPRAESVSSAESHEGGSPRQRALRSGLRQGHRFHAESRQTAEMEVLSALITVLFDYGNRGKLITFCILCQYMPFYIIIVS